MGSEHKACDQIKQVRAGDIFQNAGNTSFLGVRLLLIKNTYYNSRRSTYIATYLPVMRCVILVGVGVSDWYIS